MNFRKSAKESVSLNITPLIDVVFLLLIFFMISTTFSKESQINLNLPDATNSSMLDSSQERIEISIDQQGHYSVNAQSLVNNQTDTLERAILKVTAMNKELPFVITGDAKAPHQAIITVMNVAGELGFKKLYITTEHIKNVH